MLSTYDRLTRYIPDTKKINLKRFVRSCLPITNIVYKIKCDNYKREGCTGYCEADQADSVKAAENTAKAVCDKGLQTIKKIRNIKKQQQSEEKESLLSDK